MGLKPPGILTFTISIVLVVIAAGSKYAQAHIPMVNGREFALVVLALWRRFPYHLFFKTHRLMAPLFLAFVFHAVVLTPADYWTAPVGPVLALLLAAGSAAAGVSLFRRIGQLNAACAKCHLYNAGRIMRMEIISPALGHATHWPIFRGGEELMTFQGRFKRCMEQMRAVPYGYDSVEWNDLEYFLSYLSNGIPLKSSVMRK